MIARAAGSCYAIVLCLVRDTRRRSRLAAIACAGVAVVSLSSAVRADEAPLYVSLRYAVVGSAERCWDEGDFRRHVVKTVRYDPFRADAPISVSVHVSGSNNLVDGRVEWRSASGAAMGEHRFFAKDGNCVKLLTEMSFAVGLQIELLRPKPSAMTAAVSPSGSTGSSASVPPARSAPSPSAPTAANARAATPPPNTSTLPDNVTDERASRAASPPWRLRVGVGPSVAWGISPSLTAEGRLFFGIRRGDLSLELGAEETLPVTDRQTNGSAFRQNLLGASISVCMHQGALAACLLGQASELRVSGLNVAQPRSPTAFVAQAGLRVGRALQLGGPCSLTPHVDALGLLTPRSVALNHVDVWAMPRFSMLAGIDLAARFR
jgi:hypothetical protein